MWSQMARFCSFYAWVIFHCVIYLTSPYLFIYPWAFRLLPCLDYCKSCCNDQGRCIYLFKLVFFFLSFFFLFLFLAAPGHMEFPGNCVAMPDPSTHGARPGIKSQCSRDAADPHCARVGTHAFVFFRKISRSEIVGSCGNFIFNFLRNLHTVFHNAIRTNLHSHQQRASIPFAPASSPAFVICCIFDDGHSARCVVSASYLIMVLTCTSLMISDVEHLFMCLLAICTSSLKKKSIQFLCPLFNRVVGGGVVVIFWVFLFWWIIWVLCIAWLLTL